MLSGEASNTNFNIFGLTCPGLTCPGFLEGTFSAISYKQKFGNVIYC